jgi:hypothetical protein
MARNGEFESNWTEANCEGAHPGRVHTITLSMPEESALKSTQYKWLLLSKVNGLDVAVDDRYCPTVSGTGATIVTCPPAL